jgi:hypothetical protein
MFSRSYSKTIKLKNKFIILFIYLSITISTMMLYYILNTVHDEKVVNSTVIAERLSKISELSTIKYSYSNVLVLRNSKKFNDLSIPFTEKSFIIKYSGYIKAGVDLKNVTVIVNKKNVTITLKKAIILDHVINSGDLFVYDEKSSMFNKLSMQDMIDEIKNEKTKVETNLLKTGFLDEANANTKLLLQGILLDMGFENATIIFK